MSRARGVAEGRGLVGPKGKALDGMGETVAGTEAWVERRRECRIPVAMDGTVKAQDGRWFCAGVVEDLHRFGARARLPDMEALAEDEPIVMDFALPSAPQDVPGRVRWAKRCEGGGLQCGISFDQALSMHLPLETVTAACARLQEQTATRRTQAFSSLLEKTTLSLHGETWAGGLFAVSAEPAQHLLNSLGTRLELAALRLQKAMAESRSAFPEAPLHPVMARASTLFQELQSASAKIKDGIHCLRLVQGALALQPESYLYTVDPAQVIRRSVSVMESLCGFLEGKMGALRFHVDVDGLPLLAVRPVDFSRSVNTCLLGLLESALATDGSHVAVESFVANGWVGLRFGHDGFRMLHADDVHISPKDLGTANRTANRDEGTVLRFYHAILPLREYDVSLHIHAESGRNRVHVRFPSAHVFSPERLKPREPLS